MQIRLKNLIERKILSTIPRTANGKKNGVIQNCSWRWLSPKKDNSETVTKFLLEWPIKLLHIVKIIAINSIIRTITPQR